MLKALLAHGVTPDLIVGTSVGAVNGAWLAGHPDQGTAELERIWASMKRSTVFPADPLRGLAAFAGRTRGLVSQRGVRSLLQRHLGFERLEDATVPLHVVRSRSSPDATSCVVGRCGRGCDGQCRHPCGLRSGRHRRCGADGRRCREQHPDLTCGDLGADVVWVFCAGYSCALRTPPRGALAMGLATR